MELQGSLFWYGLPVFAALVLIEIAIGWRRGIKLHDWRESLATIGIGIGQKLSNGLKLGLAGGVSYVVWQHRLLDVPLDTWWGLLALFLAVEFVYYWFHRLSHEVRWLWATHAVHHSPEHLNILAAHRLGWTGLISGGWLLFLPLHLLGFHPAAVALTLALNLLYQSWIHTELVPRLGWLEYVLNTPSNHRVHHATNIDYLDHNYGGVLIIFDRLFGTYVAERADEPCRYGLVKPLNSFNPLRIAFHEWINMARDAVQARSLSELAGYLFGPPGWQPDGRGMTTAALRAARKRPPAPPAHAVRPAVTWRGRLAARAWPIVAALAMVTALTLLAASTHAIAQQVPANIRAACQKDVETRCANVAPGAGRIRACMRANAETLSPDCRAALGLAPDVFPRGG